MRLSPQVKIYQKYVKIHRPDEHLMADPVYVCGYRVKIVHSDDGDYIKEHFYRDRGQKELIKLGAF